MYNCKRVYQDLQRRLVGYSAKIEDRVKFFIDEATKIAKLTDFEANGVDEFSFAKFPQTKDRLMALRMQNVADIQNQVMSAIDIEWARGYDMREFKEYVSKKYNPWKIKQRMRDEQLKEALEKFKNRKVDGKVTSKEKFDEIHENLQKQVETALSVSLSNGESAANISKRIFKQVSDMRTMEHDYQEFFGRKPDCPNAMYQAKRLARTEINIAYRTAEQERWRSLDFVVGYRIQLSGNHPEPDICDDLQGNYPKDFRFSGWHPNCYAEGTKVLTMTGWKLFADVTDDDLILSLNPETRHTEWVGIDDRQCHSFKGELVHFHNNALDCLVTPEHQMVYLNKSDGKIKMCSAKDYRKGKGGFYRSCKYNAPDKDTISIGDNIFKFDDFCEFMGYYLSDGSLLRGSQITIAQKDEEDAKDAIIECLSRMNLVPHIKNNVIDVYNCHLNSYLRGFGKCVDKYIPSEILTASARQIDIFLSAFAKCDGHVRKPKSFLGGISKGERCFFTTSPQLASDLGECLLKIGHHPSYSIKEPKTAKKKDGSIIHSNYDCYIIRDCSSKSATVFEKDLVPYEGNVYDLTLERNHIMYVQYSGKCFWGSNCFCVSIPILKTEDEFFAEGSENNNDSVNKVTDVPQEFKDWVAKNRNKIENPKTRNPYFIQQNPKIVKKILDEAPIVWNKELFDALKSKPYFKLLNQDKKDMTLEEFENIGKGLYKNLDLRGLHNEFVEALKERGLEITEFNVRDFQDKFERFTIKVTAKNKEGKYLTIHRMFQKKFGDLSVDHALFEMDSSLQGKGLSKELFKIYYKQYQRIGVKNIEVFANIDVGGYTWAKYGFSAQKFDVEYLIDKAIGKNMLTEAKDIKKMLSDWYKANPNKNFPMRLIAEQSYGKKVLLGSDWEGWLDLTNESERSVFEEYLGLREAKVKKPTALEIAKKRHEDRTLENIAEIQDKWDKRRLQSYRDRIFDASRNLPDKYTSGITAKAAEIEDRILYAFKEKATHQEMMSLLDEFRGVTRVIEAKGKRFANRAANYREVVQHKWDYRTSMGDAKLGTPEALPVTAAVNPKNADWLDKTNTLLENRRVLYGDNDALYKHYKKYAGLGDNQHRYNQFVKWLGWDAETKEVLGSISRYEELLKLTPKQLEQIPPRWRKDFNNALAKIKSYTDWADKGFIGIYPECEYAWNIYSLSTNDRALKYGLAKLSSKTPARLFIDFFDKIDGFDYQHIPEKLFFEQMSRFSPLQTSGYFTGAHRSGRFNHVYIGLHQKMIDRFKRSDWYKTNLFYHEYGHDMVHQFGWLNDKEWINFFDAFCKEIADSKRLDAYKSAVFRVKGTGRLKEEVGAFTDTLQAASPDHKVIANFGHEVSYFVNGGKNAQMHEFIAHMSENFWGGNEYFNQLAPKLYKDTLRFMEKHLGVPSPVKMNMDILHPVGQKTPQQIAADRHAARTAQDVASIQKEWNRKRYNDLMARYRANNYGNSTSAWKSVNKIYTDIRDGASQQVIEQTIADTKRQMDILDKARARQAARTAEQASDIQKQWNMKRYNDLRKQWIDLGYPKESAAFDSFKLLYKNIYKQYKQETIEAKFDAIKRAMKVQEKAKIRHANRTQAQIDDIKARNASRHARHDAIRDLANEVISKYDYAELNVDIVDLKFYTQKDNLTKMSKLAQQIGAKAQSIQAKAQSFADLIDNPEQWLKTATINELEGCYNAIESKLTYLSQFTLAEQKKKLNFEVVNYFGGNMGGVQQKYANTWKISQNAYAKRLKAVNNEIDFNGIKSSIQQYDSWVLSHPKAIKINDAWSEIKAELSASHDFNTFDVASLKAKYDTFENDVKHRIAAEKSRLKKKQMTSGNTTSFEGKPEDYTKARKDVAKYFRTNSDANDYFDYSAKEYWKVATQAEKEAFDGYTAGSAYITEPLRAIPGHYYYDYRGSRGTIIKSHIDRMTEALEKCTFRDDIWIKRDDASWGVEYVFKIPDLAKYRNNPSALVGMEGIDDSFLSCGDNRSTRFTATGHKDVIYNIYCPQGTKGVYATPFSSCDINHGSKNYDGITKCNGNMTWENEIILQRGTKYRITKAEYNSAKDIWYIDVDVLSQNPKAYDLVSSGSYHHCEFK